MRSSLRVAGVMLVAVIVAGGATRASAASPITLPRYLARLNHALALARAGAARPSPAALAAVRTSLGLPLEVQLPGGPVDISRDPILSSLGGWRSADFAVAGERIEALRRLAVATEASHPVADLRGALQHAYRGIVVPAPTVSDRLHALVGGSVAWIMFHLSSMRGPSADLTLLGLGLLALAALGFLVWRTGAWQEVRVGLVGDRRVRGERPRETVDWRRRTREDLERGDLHAAVRSAYRSLVATLAARGVVRGAPGLTAGECRRAVLSSLPGLDPVVSTAVQAFEGVAYGGRDARREDVDALRSAEQAARSA